MSLSATSIAAGAIIAYVFFRRQQRLADPLIDLSLFGSTAFSASLAVNVLGFFIAFGTFLFIAQYLQLVLGLSPLKAGLWTAPSGVAFVAGSMLAPVFAGRMRPTYVIACGFALAAAGFAALTQIGASGGLAVVVTGYVTLSLGLAPVFTMTTDLIVGAAPPERAGVAAGVAETSSELGGALGIAVLGSLVTAIYRSQMALGVPVAVPPRAAEAARDTLGGAVETAAGLGGPNGMALLEAARNAFTEAVVLASIVSAVLAVFAAVVVPALLRDLGQRAAVEEAAL